MSVVSTYRLQLRADECTLADAQHLLDYLDELGVSHVYLSPILTAVQGSSHGYDVTDPTSVSEALGGTEALAQLSAGARARGMGLVIDIVPNHVGVDQPAQNRWWWDVLRRGRESPFATFFDIDWSPDNGVGGKLALPMLASDDDVLELRVDGDLLRLGELSFPIAAGTATGSAREIHDRQHYRLISWRRGLCSYRRFFAITSLAALRQEDPAVFDASHREVRRWFDAGLVDGLRVDHPDGMSDPPGYLHQLREIAGPDAWIVIEKILAVDEPLDPTLPVAGTTGYDALREIGGLFIDPLGEHKLKALAESSGWGSHGTPALQRELKAKAVTHTMANEVGRLRRSILATAEVEHPHLEAAIAALVSHIGVYRSDYQGLWPITASALAHAAAEQPELAEPLHIVALALTEREPAVRLQQLCGAATAKATEDCLFYRDPVLVSLNEVGGNPEFFGVSAAEFHHRNTVRARLWPLTMTTLSTHDTKRGEDVRARIGVLSQVPDLWSKLVTDWSRRAPAPDPITGLFLWQNIFGVWPLDGQVTAELRNRLHSYAEKAIREAELDTSWTQPDEEFEAAVRSWLDTVLDGDIADQMTGLTAKLDPHARSDALGQKLVQLTVPGVPDVYQGTELWEDSLVDPDNRRPVDFGARRTALKSLAHPKMRVTAAALRLRRRRPETFLSGGYSPMLATGAQRERLVAFGRGDDVVVAVSLWTVGIAETGWEDTTLTLPDGTWTDRLSGRRRRGGVSADELFDSLPVALLEREAT